MKKALFLDRDGVINIEKNYLYKIEDFEFIDGIMDLCTFYQGQGYEIFVLTNQSGIARKYYTEDDFNIVTTWMIKEFAKKNIIISHVYFCPHHPSISGECDCRKPNTGMFLRAKKEYNLDLSQSIMIGDNERDIEAGLNAGLRETYLFDITQTIEHSKATKIVSKLQNIWKEKC